MKYSQKFRLDIAQGFRWLVMTVGQFVQAALPEIRRSSLAGSRSLVRGCSASLLTEQPGFKALTVSLCQGIQGNEVATHGPLICLLFLGLRVFGIQLFFKLLHLQVVSID